MPTISVVVPVYKVEEYLHDCVDSILAQTYTDFELILVDDGSPDRCGAICDDYAAKDRRVRVIHQENQGLSGARNSGMDAASGAYITFVDSDDVVHETYLEILLAAMNDNTDIAICQLEAFVDNAVPDKMAPGTWKQAGYERRNALIKLYEGSAELPINAWGKLFRRSLLEELRFPVGRLHEDQFFTPRVFYRANMITSCDAKLYYYRTRQESIMRTVFTAKRYDDLWAIDSCIAFFREKGEAEIVEAAMKRRQRLLCTYALYAHGAGVTVPEQYRVGLVKSLRYLRRNVSADKYQYCLAQIHPKLAVLDAYVRKLESIICGKK